MEKLGRPQSTGSQSVGHNQSDPACIDTRFFIYLFIYLFIYFACGSSALVRVECEGGETVWLARILGAPRVQDTDIIPLPQELWP